MSHVLITGAGGFIGRTLTKEVLRTGIGNRPVEQLTLVDLDGCHPEADDLALDKRIQWIGGSVADPKVLAACTTQTIDVAFHLASVPGGAAEKDYRLGRRVNLDATLDLIEALGAQAKPAHFVYASSIAVYGELLAPVVEGQTLPAPALSYGAHKLACETMLADATRKGWVAGCSLRLPGVVARPGTDEGLISAFMSQLFWRMKEGQPIEIPVRADGQAWWISARTCAQNLLHAAQLPQPLLAQRSTYQMPALHLSLAAIAQGLAQRFDRDVEALVRYTPIEPVDRLFARYPSLFTPFADSAGFTHDGCVARLIENALSD